jgi:hypothetical protein
MKWGPYPYYGWDCTGTLFDPLAVKIKRLYFLIFPKYTRADIMNYFNSRILATTPLSHNKILQYCTSISYKTQLNQL